MEELDSEMGPLYSRNLKMYEGRDHVEFVPFRDVNHD